MARGYHVESRARGGKGLVTNDVHQKLLLAASPETRNILHALHDTGARPHEILQGGSMAVLGTSMAMILKHYAHVGEHPALLLKELARFTRT